MRGLVLVGVLLVSPGWIAPLHLTAAERPNIIWLTSEDNGPHLGCYGDTYATTPQLDALARRGIVYSRCWSNAPVCAPARTTIITGVHPPSLGAEHMRSEVRMPAGWLLFPQYLRAAGYYCTNNAKEDYNVTQPGQVWDESSTQAHWRHRAPGQPFFAVFNTTVSHESQIRARPHQAVHAAADVRVPAYHPDHPVVRQDWAQYYDRLSEVDAFVGRHLRELEEAGLGDDTIVFYFGDHGSGMPRCKRWPYNSGLRVPMIVSVPPKFRAWARSLAPGSTSDRLISFVDLAPTVMCLAGVALPAHLQGVSFLGPQAGPAPSYLFGYRGRMDERLDLVRTVWDGRYVYVRNFMPHLIYGQHIDYMFQTPTTRIWKQLYEAGQLNPQQSRFWEPKPTEELYDLDSDPDEVQDLATDPAYQEVLSALRTALRQQTLKIRDLGFLPEDELHLRSGSGAPYAMAQDPNRYPLERILATAEFAAARGAEGTAELATALQDPDSSVRYWGALGLVIRGQPAVATHLPALQQALQDPAPAVRVTAARAIGQFAPDHARSQAWEVLLVASDVNQAGIYTALSALNAFDVMSDLPTNVYEKIAVLPSESSDVPPRMRSYVNNLLEHLRRAHSSGPQPGP